MPKQTFFHLPEQKRQTIEQAALDEFSAHGFDHSNMNRIVAHSGIAKGSFYQYFEDKKDLYFHLVDMLYQKKIQIMEPIMQHCADHSFSHNLEALFRAGLAFAADDTRLHQLGADFAALRQSFVASYLEKYEPEATNIYTTLLQCALDNGELREDIDDMSLISMFIATLVTQTTRLIISQWNDRQTEQTIEEMLTFIKQAILKVPQGDT